jgi:hypothetical protein
MICILRVKAQKTNVPNLRKAVTIKPYRIDEDISDFPETSYLHYDVTDKDASFSEGMKILKYFINSNINDIKKISSFDGSELEIDVGINIYHDEISKTIKLDSDIMDILAKNRISLTLSLYQTSEQDNDSDQRHPHY